MDLVGSSTTRAVCLRITEHLVGSPQLPRAVTLTTPVTKFGNFKDWENNRQAMHAVLCIE